MDEYLISTRFVSEVDGEPDQHYVVLVRTRQGIRYHDLAAGPFDTREEARAERDRIEAARLVEARHD